MPGFEIPALTIAVLAAFGLLLFNRGQKITILLGVLYLAQFILISNVWRLEMAVVKLVSGWMTAAIFGVTLVNKPIMSIDDDSDENSLGVFFRLMTGLFVLVLGISFGPRLIKWFAEINSTLVYAAIFVVGMGILNLGLSHYPIHVMVGLLTTLSGFEILYAAIEDSVLVAGMLAITNLALALAAAYLHLVQENTYLELSE